MTTTTKKFGRGNVAFAIKPDDVTTRRKASRRAADRRDRERMSAKDRRRFERQKELGDDAPMNASEFDQAIEDIREAFGIALSSTWAGITVRPRCSRRELFAAAAAVREGTSHRDRVKAVQRLSKLGFRLVFDGDDRV